MLSLLRSFIILLAVFHVSAPAQRGWWKAKLPGGEYQVRLSSITSFGMHEYIVDNSVRVLELTVGTSGAVTTRIYYLEPFKPDLPVGQSIINQAEEKVGSIVERVAGETGQAGLLTAVVKNYPATTHAKTIEYRVEDEKTVQSLFSSLQRALKTDSKTDPPN